MAGCLSVSLSVTLTYRDVIGWNTSKMISRLVSLGVRSLQNPTSWIYSKGTPRNSSWNRDAVWKRGFPRKKNFNISETQQDSTMLLLRTICAFNWCNDLGWPWRVIIHSFSKHLRHDVVIYLFRISLLEFQSGFSQMTIKETFDVGKTHCIAQFPCDSKALVCLFSLFSCWRINTYTHRPTIVHLFNNINVSVKLTNNIHS